MTSAGSGAGPAEPPPSPPEDVADLFGRRAPLAIRYVELLADRGVTRGLVGPREVPRLWTRHVLNCLALARWIPPGGDVCDVGSGAGLPGLVLALARPDLSVTLLEPLARRAEFLTDAVADLELPQVRVLRARAEDVVGEVSAGVVTARAVAPLDRLAGWAMPLVRAPGELLAVKGRLAAAELHQALPTLRRYGAAAWMVERVSVGCEEVEATVVRVRIEKRAQPVPRRSARPGGGRR